MSPIEAEKIVQDYGEALAKGVDGIARSQSLLLCSKASIKYAFYVYIAELIKIKALTEEVGSNLTFTYSCMDHFIEDKKAEEINIIHKQIKNKEIDQNDPSHKEKFEKYSEFLLKNFTFSGQQAREEINQYIEECYVEIKYYEDVKKYALNKGKISTSDIQRKFKVGYATASRILDSMVIEGLIGKGDEKSNHRILKK